MMLAVSLSQMVFIMLRYIPSIAILLRVFFLKSQMGIEFCKMLFLLVIYWGDHMIFILCFANVVFHVDWFAYIEPFFIPGINPTW